MNANVSIYQDSVKDSSGILTSESNEIGSLKIIMPDKLNQLTARSSYICHIDDFVKGNKDYYGFDIQSDREMEYDYELIINKIKHINNNTGKHEYISIGNYILLCTISKTIKGHMIMYPFIIQSFFSFFFPFPSFLTLQERVFRKRGSRGSVFGL